MCDLTQILRETWLPDGALNEGNTICTAFYGTTLYGMTQNLSFDVVMKDIRLSACFHAWDSLLHLMIERWLKIVPDSLLLGKITDVGNLRLLLKPLKEWSPNGESTLH